MAKAPKNWIDEDEDEPKKAPPPPAPKTAEPDVVEAKTIPLEPSSGGDGELPSQMVPYPTQDDVAAKAAPKLKGK
jgi:hypothetical protein